MLGGKLKFCVSPGVFETQTSTFDQMNAEDSARARSPSIEHETNYFESKFDLLVKKLEAKNG